MDRAFTIKILSAVALSIVLLGQLSSVAAGMLLCIGDGAELDCCRKPHDSPEPGLDLSSTLLDGTDCDCCITVHAAPATAGTRSPEASLEIACGSGLLRKVVASAGVRRAPAPSADAVGSDLASLRTVVLLI